jgi:eukaryotic-like serine/threonine-protein kinase
MALEPGTRLGPYEIVSPAGAGGMGEVYRARDTRLDRTVALKVLPPDLTNDPAARQRFEREARAVAALSHPHICTLHDIGQQDGTDFLVMEYLDGETLAARLGRGKLPLDQALHYGIQIADGLAAAHKAGIVHRDLKPGNIMLTKSGAKLLDFGLAKPGVQIAGSGITQLVTEGPLTGAGTLLGTLHYMAPEQLQGAEADTRTDVFGFGCVLYEMITGRRAFAGDTPASVIAAVLEHEPAPLPANSEGITHPALEAFIRTCVAKNPEDRWSSGRDVWLVLRRLGDAGEAPPALTPSLARSRRVVIPSVIAGMALATIVAALYRPWSRPPMAAAAPAVQAFIDFRHVWLMNPMLSPDGRYVSLLAFAGAGGQDGRTIFVRRLADGQTTWLAGTEHALPLTWSPESRSLAVVVNGEIRAVDIDTGSTRIIGRAPDGMVPSDGAWNGENILLGGPRLRRMSVADGHVTDVYPGDPEVSLQYLPSFLPGGRRFLYSQDSKNQARRGLFLGTMDSSDITRLLPEPARAIVSPRGYLLYGRQGKLFAQRFDAEHNRLAGDPASIGSALDFRGLSAAFDVSGDTLVWSKADVFPPAKLTWFGRTGRKLNEIGESRPYYQIALAPDGQRVVAEEDDPKTSRSLFLIELTRHIHARLTTGDDPEHNPVWSPDSREVAFNSVDGLSTRRIDQSGRTTLFASQVAALEDWTHDGRFVIIKRSVQNISAVPLSGDRTPISLAEFSSMVDEPHVSRDGRWLAYSSNETAQWEVYVQAFMKPGGRVRVSTNGGSQPRWRADGAELFYFALDGALTSVDMTDPARPGAPRKLFDLGFWVNPVQDQYDVTADGQRFLFIVPEGQQATRLTVLTNWPSLLEGR